MDITSLSGITSDYISQVAEKNKLVDTSDKSFSATLNSAMDMLNETNDLQIALQKANVALQYTVAVRDKMLDAYKEIMNMSI